jgi:hypothetical protein
MVALTPVCDEPSDSEEASNPASRSAPITYDLVVRTWHRPAFGSAPAVTVRGCFGRMTRNITPARGRQSGEATRDGDRSRTGVVLFSDAR